MILALLRPLEGPIRTLANPRGPPVALGRASDEPRELQLVLDHGWDTIARMW
jgi:hypothetical protein